MSPSLFFVSGLSLIFIIYVGAYLYKMIGLNSHKHHWVKIDRWDSIDKQGYQAGYTILYQCTTCKKTRKEKVRVD